MQVLQVGVGNWGINHKRILSDLGVLVATVDKNGKEDYDDVDDVNVHYDHVVICTPLETHYKLVKRFLNDGKNVFVEKPLAKTTKECKELLDIAKNKGLKLQCGYVERFNPEVIKLKKSSPLTVFTRENRHYPHIKDSILLDTSVHDIDLALWYYEEYPYKINAVHDNKYAVITLRFTTGTAVIITSWLSDRKVRTINGNSIISSHDSLKDELLSFLSKYETYCDNALDVMKVIESI